MEFECSVRVNLPKDDTPVFLGPFTQGPANARFLYIDIGTMAGQKDSCWERRMKIPLTGISSQMIQEAISGPGCKIETVVAGLGKDGSPNCGTVKPFNGWKLNSSTSEM